MKEPYRDATLGDLLRERRTTLGLSMRDVAGTALSPTAINNIEKGKIKPTIETVLYLCQVLQLHPEQALLFYPDLAKSAPVLMERVEALLAENLPDEAVLLLYDMYWVATEQSSCEDLIAEIQYKLAIVFDQLGRHGHARIVMTEAYKHFLACKDVTRQVESLGRIGSFALHEQRIYRAISHLTEAADLAHRYQLNNESVAFALTHLAEAHLLHDHLTESLSFNQQAEVLYKRLQNADGMARIALQQGRILSRLGDASAAYRIAMQAFHHFEQQQNIQELSEAALIVGDILCKLEDFEKAKTYFLRSLDWHANAQPRLRFRVEYRLASLEFQSGHDQAARAYAQAALESADLPDDRSKVFQLLAQFDLKVRNLDGYVVHMNHACETLQKSGYEYAAALLQCELADETDDMELLRSSSRTLRQLQASCQCR